MDNESHAEVQQMPINTYTDAVFQAVLKQPGMDELKATIRSLGYEIKSSEGMTVSQETKAGPEVSDKVEVENKFEVTDVPLFQEKVLAHGFQLKKDITQDDRYVVLERGKTGNATEQDFRIRRVFDNSGKFLKGELKWGGPTGNEMLDRPAVEVSVPDDQTCQALEQYLVDKVGVSFCKPLIKHRRHYTKAIDDGLTAEIELDTFGDPRNAEKIRGRTFAQVAIEVDPETRDKAIVSNKRIAEELGLGTPDNRDFLIIAEQIM